jgi:hypothetical protein
MTCRTVMTPAGPAIVCGPRPRSRKCTDCRSAPATLLCDWKLREPDGKPTGKTCDRPICAGCAEEVAEGKHLCVTHRALYRRWLDARRGKGT